MPEPDIQTWALKQKDLVFLSNSRAYQPNLYGEKIMLEYAERFTEDDIVAKHLVYRQQKNEAESEESKLGLGIVPNNEKTWFDYVSKVPETFTGY